MFLLFQIFIRQIESLACLSFEAGDFGGGSSKGSLSESEIAHAQSKKEMTFLINNRELNPNDPQHRQFLIRYLQSIGGNDGIQASDVEGGLFSMEKMALKRVAQLLQSYQEYQGVQRGVREQTRTELDVLNDFYLNRSEILETSTTQRSTLKEQGEERVSQTQETTVQGSEFVSSPTIETSTPIWGLFTGKTDRIHYLDANPKVKSNISSLLKGKSKSELIDIYNTLDEQLQKYVKNGQAEIGMVDAKKIGSILKGYGYKVSKGMFSAPQEIIVVISTLRDMLTTQSKLSQASDEQKVSLLFDFDSDGVMESNSEMEYFYQSIQSLHLDRGDGFNEVARSLGFGGKEALFQMMSENLFDSRQRFQKAYQGAVDQGFNPTQISKSGRTEKVGVKILQEKKEIEALVDAQLKKFFKKNIFNNPQFQKISDANKSLFMERLGAKVGGFAISGIGIKYDISQLTHDLLDSITLGVSGSGIGISFSKRLFQDFLGKYGTDISVGISTSLEPLLSVSQSVGGKINNPKELYEMTTKSKVRTSFTGSAGSLYYMGLINFSLISYETKAGIESMVYKTHLLLQKITKKILAGESHYGGTPSEEQAYTQMKQQFDIQTSLMNKQEKKEYSEIFEHGYVTAYRNSLYKQAEGGRMTDFGAGVVYVAGLVYVPFITYGGEYTRVTTSQRIRNPEDQTQDTLTSIPIEKVGGQHAQYRGHHVFQMPRTFQNPLGKGEQAEVEVSIGANSHAQVEISGGSIRIGGSVREMSIMEITGGGRLRRVLVIDGGVTGPNGVYQAGGKTGKIHQDFESSSTAGGSPIDLSETTQSPKIQTLGNLLTGLLDRGALAHRDTVGMTRLSRSIQSLNTTGKPSLEQVWQQYLKVISYQGKGKSFEAYATSKGYSEEQLDQLTSTSESVENDADKKFILQSVGLALSSQDHEQRPTKGKNDPLKAGSIASTDTQTNRVTPIGYAQLGEIQWLNK